MNCLSSPSEPLTMLTTHGMRKKKIYFLIFDPKLDVSDSQNLSVRNSDNIYFSIGELTCVAVMKTAKH